MAVTEPTYEREPAEFTDMTAAANPVPLWTSSLLPDDRRLYMPLDLEPQQIAFASSAPNVDWFSSPGGPMIPSQDVGVPTDCGRIGSNFVLYNPQTAEIIPHMQQQQQLLQLQQTQSPIAYALHNQLQQQYNTGTGHSFQIQTHNLQHHHDTFDGRYAQLYTPTTSYGFNNINGKPNSEVRPNRVDRASQPASTDGLFGRESPDSQTGHTSPSGSSTNQSQSYREKNRLAASKCREKSKKLIDDLRTRDRELTAQMAKLVADAASLKEQVLDLKREVLCHANCNCELIQSYLTSAAKRVSGGVATRPPLSK